MPDTLTLAQARRIALKAQGLSQERPTDPATARSVGRCFTRMQLVQIDSVNVLSRSHYLPFYSRLGGYDRALLDRMSQRGPRSMMEFWAHEASFIQPVHFAALQTWQRRRWVNAERLDAGQRERLQEDILGTLASSRPLTSAQLTDRLGHVEERRNEHWGWNWNAVKVVLEHLFARGEITSAGRTEQFERRYTLTAKAFPAVRGVSGHALADPAAREQSLDLLVEASARAHGVGTVRCLADYFRLPVRPVAGSLERLAAAGVVRQVDVQGWGRGLFRHAEASAPRRLDARALLSPFDPVVFERSRLEALFGFHYRIEIYTPAHRRRYGYYVLPFLLRDTMAARVDLKADRAASALVVRSAHGEPDAPSDTAAQLAAELEEMAAWLGLDSVRLEGDGELDLLLRRHL
ncbi:MULTISPECIES: crosslink repair DNA glycosylase YcaQ family protein [Arthrobacter]|uniref:Crosslink repair DNA glycosylase YcaQ family protein n=2 Tax=Arthrobacter TaxID=1663 RepID=A0ABU9KLY6_9MICC|nr:crosslink repair DNA glycosylase YcaQ family protein [Arthrobacter sp. YJM1]MDP5227218.1 crosslink repair DNA glycosylase YcaQ family protein [Arthrobacter sp. YJM1]